MSDNLQPGTRVILCSGVHQITVTRGAGCEWLGTGEHGTVMPRAEAEALVAKYPRKCLRIEEAA